MADTAMLNVRDFGAAGDGSADDTAAIQKAVDKAAETRATVFVPDGVFQTSTIRLRSYVGLLGNPTWSYRAFGGSILRLADPSARCLLDLTGAVGVTVNGLCLDGAKLGDSIHGLLFDKPDYGKEEDAPRIERCRISEFTGDGVRLGRIWCFSIRGCMVSHNKGTGLWVRGWDGFVLDNWLSGNRGAGYGAFEENASITMTGNRIEWNALGGIVVHGGSHYNVTGNYIDRSGGPGIALLARNGNGCRIFSIVGNVIYRSGAPNWRALGEHESCHVRFDSSRGLVFSGNSLNVGRDDGGKGAWSPKHAMIFGGLADSVIKDNVMHQAAIESLVLDLGGHGENVVVKDNVGSVFTPQ